MRAMFSILLIALLVFQIGGLAAASMPCSTAGMEMDACNGAAVPTGEDACLATGCCCTLCPGVEPPDEFEPVALHPIAVGAVLSGATKVSSASILSPLKPQFPVAGRGSLPPLYRLKSSYLI